ncbi:hypothetical protein BDV25DRAFT_168899 [Aspergillus avenaceus]|uniref:Uncharacterized protein n=1 Tax=Aspergillus avenaceus TaxID=36643 RepID=A0A5N6U481_ASPAV|nr:hypothetical protein BDV25DRAFT_168899 [Aspergillus avenaceus]
MLSQQPETPELPGFSLPLNYKPDRENPWEPGLFPNALDYNDIEGGSVGRITVFREILMMRVIDYITDKPNWDRKVFNAAITSKWWKEISESGKDVTPRMMDYVIEELQWKAGVLHETGSVMVFDNGVVKSDTAVPEDLCHALRGAVAPLEDVPGNQKDYHPGTDGKVVNLVHPSMFPVIYGRTKILPDRVIRRDDCLASMEDGELLSIPPENETNPTDSFYNRYPWRSLQEPELKPFSRSFQWLPCDVKFNEGRCRVTSYINNLHPYKHRALYDVIEGVISRAVPLWDKALTQAKEYGYQRRRIEYEHVDYLTHPEPEPLATEHNTTDEGFDLWSRSRPIQRPEPGDFEPPDISPRHEINLRDRFRDKGLQVIVKLANIELTPDKPDYAGGTWHVEGQLNERICATAVYYYDSENITESTLAFRQRADKMHLSYVEYEEEHHEFLHEVYGFGLEVTGRHATQVTQELGTVTCREGRMIAFPNILQHRVSPFSLADRSKPGHRKMLALFLVDPYMRIISSSNVPPQQYEWGREKRELVDEVLSRKLPQELYDMVCDDALEPLITVDEAKEYRRQLMEERSVKMSEQNQAFEIGSFSLCEH